MTEDFAKMFAAMMEQGQKMASAFMPGMACKCSQIRKGPIL